MTSKTTLISLYSKFSNVGGAQNMCISIHEGLIKKCEIKRHFLVSQTSFDTIDHRYKLSIPQEHYKVFNALELIRNFEDAIFISHHRKLTSLLLIYSKLLRKKINVFHVAHNEFNNLKHFTWFPKHVIAVSEGVKENHQSYFDLQDVKVIYNGLKKVPETKEVSSFTNKEIKVLLPGRITKVKQQLLLAKYLKNRIPKEIKILFAGDGEDLDALKSIIKNNEQLECLGRVDDMPTLYKEVDFVMLFSEKEGLPLTLIEATSYALPILCNDVGGNLEILENAVNGYLLESLDHLVEVLYRLVDLNSSEYHVLSQNSRSVFENKFEYDTMISNYYNLIKPYVN